MNVTEYLDRKGFEYRLQGTEARLNCPFCDDTEGKFNINLESGLWLCWHANRCGKSGNLYQLQKALGDTPEGVKDAVKHKTKQYRRPEAKGIIVTPSESILKWFADRKISAETVSRFRVGESNQGEIVFPYIKDGRLVNLKYRRLPKIFRQEIDAEPCLFGRDLIGQEADEVLILEGETDVLAAWQCGLEAVSVPGGTADTRWIETEWEYLGRFRRLLLCFDVDEAGDKGIENAVKRLGWRWELRRVELPFKDLNDCLLRGVVEDDIRGCIYNARSLGPEEVKALREIPQEGIDEVPKGLPSEIPGIDQKLGGWRLGELSIHAGDAGSGKTTGTCQESIGALSRKQRVAVCSLEMPIRALISIMVKQSKMVTKQFFDTFGDDLYFIDIQGTVDIVRLLDLMAYCRQRFDCRYFIVDSLGRIDIPHNDYWLQQKEVISELSRFARENEVHVHLVHHLRKPGKNQKAKAARSEIEGSVWIQNLADSVLLYNRIREADRKKNPELEGVDEILWVDKNRFRGDEGPVMLSFDKETRRFEKPVAKEGL